MKGRTLMLFAVFAVLMLPGCIDYIYIEGNGDIRTERRRAVSFDQLVNTTGFDVVYTKADTSGLAIKADGNLLDHIVTEVSGGVLEIKTEPSYANFRYSQRPVLEVSSPGLNSVLASGSGNFEADYLDGDEVSLRLSGSGQIAVDHISCSDLSALLSGSGRINLKDAECSFADMFISGSGNIIAEGTCTDNKVKISGSGNLHADNFGTKTASVTISGSGDAFTRVADELSGLISGSGNIFVKGNPHIDVRVSGSGRVINN